MKKVTLLSKMIAAIFVLSLILVNMPIEYVHAATDYPVQAVKFTTGTGKNLNIKGTSDNSLLNVKSAVGTQNENWEIKYVSDGVYKIVNMETEKLLSTKNNKYSAGTSCVIKSDEGDKTQQWKITGVDKDYLGNYLYYKITNVKDSNMALTCDSNDSSISLKKYTGATEQKWKINCDGLEGFAGNCLVSEGEKAGTIGGLLGKTVFVSDLASLKDALLKTEPLTIVISKSINNCNSKMYDLRIASNKTIIGSYGAKTLTDPRLRTDDYFKKESVSNNIILKNLDIQVKDREDVVAFAVYGSNNVWVDHCTFNNSLALDKDEVGKFIWVNRSEYAEKDPDFVTLSYNKFSHRFWGVAFGAGGTSQDRATVMYNYFDSIVHRAPQLGNGSLHVYNNFYKRSSAATKNDGYAAIKCGEGSQVYSESNRFENYQKESSGYWDYEFTVDSKATCTDVDSYTNKGEKPVTTPYKVTLPKGTKSTTWKPSSNYGYSIIKAYGDNDTKDFCTKYAGAVSKLSDLKYINYSECSKYVNKKVVSPIKSTASSLTSIDSLENSGIYMIKNVATNMYLEVKDGVAKKGTNVQQWGAKKAAAHNTWKVVSDGNGYYYLYSQLGNGKKFLLDVSYGKAANGTNIRIHTNTASDAQLFKIQKNSDGSYSILTKASNNKGCVEVKDGSKSSGANIQQWGFIDGNWQHWKFEKVN